MSGARNVRIDFGYDGREFYGSQRQANVRTVQEELENVLATVTGQRVQLALAGRTDRGVHAVGQVASGRVVWKNDLERLRYALDTLSSSDVVVYRVKHVDETFHARFSARRRVYRYRVLVGHRAPVLLRGLVWPVRPEIDMNRLNDASARLIGHYDFRSFAGAGQGSGDSEVETRRKLEVANWTAVPNELEPSGELLEFCVSANAFLPHMVRNIVGALIEVGAGRQDPDWIEKLLAMRDRKQAPPPAPPEGLVLWGVEYEDRDETE